MTTQRAASPGLVIFFSFSLRQVIGFCAGLALIAPFLILVLWTLIESSFSVPTNPLANGLGHLQWAEVGQVFAWTFAQACVSACACLMVGVMGAYGLTALAARWGRGAGSWFEAAALLPNMAPVLLLILATLKFIPQARGFWGIVFLHSLVNSGLVSLGVLHLMRVKLGRLTELAWVEGASRGRFFRRAVLPMLGQDLVWIGLFVFAICFSSFAIPLMIGGSRGATVEVLIYRLMRVDGDWTSALMLSLLQMIAILSVSFLLRKQGQEPLASRRLSTAPSVLTSWWPGVALLAFPIVLLASGFFDGVLTGYSMFMGQAVLKANLPEQIAGSSFVGLGTGFSVCLFLILLTYVRPQGRARRFLLGYAAPSSVLVGFSLLILWRATGLASLIKIICGLTLILTPAFYRLQWDALLQGLMGQIRVAETLGASDALIFSRIQLPQLWLALGTVAGLAALWAWGDFALSSVIAERSLTLAMTAQGLMDSYRLDVATVYIWMITAGGFVSYALFRGAGRVLGSTTEM